LISEVTASFSSKRDEVGIFEAGSGPDPLFVLLLAANAGRELFLTSRFIRILFHAADIAIRYWQYSPI
jgi:hypothetical protein